MRGVLLIAVGLFLGACLPPVLAGDDKSKDVGEVLKAKDFWDKAGKKEGRNWTDAEKKQIEELRATSKDDVIRLRANKVLVEMAGNVRYNVGKQDDATAIAGFRYLEANLKNPQVKKMVDAGFTHFHVSPHTTPGNVWFLIETVGSGPSGGLNLRWNSDKKAVVEMVPWGSLN